MKKRRVAILLLVPLLFCACGKTGIAEPEITSAADAAAFHLPELPDIGSYQPKKAACFYDAPLPTFREADDYGGVIPYQVTAAYGIPAYGFMTADGKIITAPVYLSVETIGAGKNAVYAAEYKTRYFTPGQKLAPKPEDDETARELELEREKAVITRYQLISGDGSKLLTLPDDVEPLVYYGNKQEAGIPWVECYRYEENGAQELFFYDFDLRPLVDLERYRPKQNCYVDVLIRTADGLTIAEHTDVYDDNADQTVKETRVVTYKNGKAQKEVVLDDYIYGVAGNLLIGESHLYTADGKALRSFSEDVSCVCDILPDCVFLSDPAEKKLIKIKNENGKTEKTVSLPDMDAYYLAVGCIVKEPCLLVEAVRDDQQQYLIYDTDLRLLHTFEGDGSGTDKINDSKTDAICAVRQMENGEAAVYRLNGELIARFPYDEDTDWLSMRDDCVFCSGENGRVSLCLAGNNEKKEYDFSMPGKETTFYDENPRFLVCECHMPLKGGWETYEWRRNESWYRLYDTKTGTLLHDNVTDFQWLDAVSRQYCSFSCSDCTYVCDGELNVIAVIPDGYYA